MTHTVHGTETDSIKLAVTLASAFYSRRCTVRVCIFTAVASLMPLQESTD